MSSVPVEVIYYEEDSGEGQQYERCRFVDESYEYDDVNGFLSHVRNNPHFQLSQCQYYLDLAFKREQALKMQLFLGAHQDRLPRVFYPTPPQPSSPMYSYSPSSQWSLPMSLDTTCVSL